MSKSLIAAAAVSVFLLAPSVDAQNWPTFRGAGARGVADAQDLPSDWNVATSQNVKWKTRIPGQGHSSPIVWGNRLFVTSAERANPPKLAFGDTGGIRLADDSAPHVWRLHALDAATGRIAWTAEAKSGQPRATRHVKSSQANSTPATDGSTVVAVFGSEGLVAFDWNGKEKWRADLGVVNPGLFGDPKSEWGHASSPVIYENRVIVQVDRHAQSFLAAYDIANGKQLWKVDRDERPVWATPTLYVGPARTELIVVGGVHVKGYDPRTGDELWRFKDVSEVKTPTAFADSNLIYFSGGYRGRPFFALRTGASGDVSEADNAKTGKFLAWRTEPGGPYTSTPVAYQGVLFAVRDEGIAVAHDAVTGERLFMERTGATHSASPVASDGKIYVAAEGGEVLVLKAGRAFEILARIDMGEALMATPAISGRTMFIRGADHVFAIAKSGAGSRTAAR